MKKKNNSKKQEKSNKTGLLIVALLLVLALIAGGTYAYWSWNSNNIVTINTTIGTYGTMGATFNGGTVTINKLAPASCTHSTYSTKITTNLSYYNETPFPGSVTFTLKLTSLTFNHGTLTATALQNVKYALTTSASSCTSNLVTTTNNTGNLSGATIGTSGTAQTENVKLFDYAFTLPANNGTASSPKSATTMYLYFWIDPTYTFTNWGSNSIQDPLQDLSFTVQWSASTIQQSA